MNILVTGGTGFLGSHLLPKLTAEGHSVRVLGRQKPSRPVEKVEYFQGDIRDSMAVAKSLQDIEAVYHLDTADDPEKTAAAYNDQGWATLHDLGWLDAEGFLFLSDRRADLILSGGVNIYPAEIEAVLGLHPAVAEAAVIGVPDAELGERPHALVVPRNVAANATLAEAIIAHCRVHLGRLKIPVAVDFLEALPRSEAGKLLRRVLKERFR